MIANFVTASVAAPLALVTGLLQSPAISARLKTAHGPFNRQVARTVHFMVLGYFVCFILVHVTMVFATGLIGNLNHITRGVQSSSLGGLLMFAIGVTPIVIAWVVAPWQYGGRFITGWFRAGFERFKPVASISLLTAPASPGSTTTAVGSST